jgi:carbonic anhydrase
VFKHMGSLGNKDDEVHPMDEIDAADLLPDSMDGWYFEGSLTTPPASQPANWFVFSDPVEVSQAQIDAYRAAADDADDHYNFNPGNRPLQDLNGRQFNELNHEIAVDGIGPIVADFGNVGVVPEPSTLVLASVALLGLGFFGRRRRNR